jgi:formate dehydrogenase subunit gamma
MERPVRPRVPNDEPVRMLARFTVAERLVHWITALLMSTCVVTGVILYWGSASILISDRRLVELIHLWAGFALPVPMLLGVLSAAYRADLRRMNRFSRDDWQWLSSRDRRKGRIPVGKFNAGQKLNAAFVCGAILVMLGTGVIMYFPHLARISLRTGATFVHDWLAILIIVLLLGHLYYALRDRGAMAGMIRGRVPYSWARREHDRWAAEMAARTLSDQPAASGSHRPAVRALPEPDDDAETGRSAATPPGIGLDEPRQRSMDQRVPDQHEPGRHEPGRHEPLPRYPEN